MTNCGKGPNAIKFANIFFDFDVFILQTKRSAHRPSQDLVLEYKHMFKDDPSYMYIHIKKKRSRIIQLVLKVFLTKIPNKKKQSQICSFRYHS